MFHFDSGGRKAKKMDRAIFVPLCPGFAFKRRTFSTRPAAGKHQAPTEIVCFRCALCDCSDEIQKQKIQKLTEIGGEPSSSRFRLQRSTSINLTSLRMPKKQPLFRARTGAKIPGNPREKWRDGLGYIQN